MAQPQGYNDGTDNVCMLIQSLYGLKQAGNIWNAKLNSTLNKIGFTQLKTDYCCYIRRIGDQFTILLVWVDDFLSISTTDALNDQLEEELNSKFKIKSLGQPSMLLEIKIHQTRDLITLSQKNFIDKLLMKFGLQDANPVMTPMDPNVKLDDENSSQDELSAQGESNN